MFCNYVQEFKRSSQYGFKKAKSCLTNLTAFYNEVTGFVDEKSTMDVVYLNVSKVFNTIP